MIVNLINRAILVFIAAFLILAVGFAAAGILYEMWLWLPISTVAIISTISLVSIGITITWVVAVLMSQGDADD